MLVAANKQNCQRSVPKSLLPLSGAIGEFVATQSDLAFLRSVQKQVEVDPNPAVMKDVILKMQRQSKLLVLLKPQSLISSNPKSKLLSLQSGCSPDCDSRESGGRKDFDGSYKTSHKPERGHSRKSAITRRLSETFFVLSAFLTPEVIDSVELDDVPLAERELLAFISAVKSSKPLDEDPTFDGSALTTYLAESGDFATSEGASDYETVVRGLGGAAVGGGAPRRAKSTSEMTTGDGSHQGVVRTVIEFFGLAKAVRRDEKKAEPALKVPFQKHSTPAAESDLAKRSAERRKERFIEGLRRFLVELDEKVSRNDPLSKDDCSRCGVYAKGILAHRVCGE